MTIDSIKVQCRRLTEVSPASGATGIELWIEDAEFELLMTHIPTKYVTAWLEARGYKVEKLEDENSN